MSDAIARGLYRTLFVLSGHEAAIPAGSLVYINDDTDGDGVEVLLPQTAKHNRWQFRPEGIPVSDEAWLSSLVPLPKEGFYHLTEHLWIGGGQTLPEGLLIQLGYTRQGQAAAFPGVLVDGGTIRFQRRGAIVSDLQVATLRRSDFKLLTPVQNPAATADTTGDAADGVAAVEISDDAPDA